jgi:Skp family chaperone for outer membrane proteins
MDMQKTELSKETKDGKAKQHDEKIAELKAMEREISEFQNTRQKELEDQSARMRANIVEEIQKVISDRVKNEGYDLVFDKSGPTLNGVPAVLYARDSYEFTSDIITVLNKNRKEEAATAPPTASATPGATEATPKPKKAK